MKIGRDAFMRAVDADFAGRSRIRPRALRLSDDGRLSEGLNAFVEKRTPNYKGR